MSEKNEEYDISDRFNKEYYVIKTNDSMIVTAENEQEQKLLDEMENTLKQKINRLAKQYEGVNPTDKETRNRITLKQCCDEFMNYYETKHKDNEKYLTKFRQTISFLYMYFREKKQMKSFNTKDANDFRNFLIKIPADYKNKKELKDKNLKILIEKKSKILQKYKPQKLSTAQEHIKRINTMFNYFERSMYIHKNPFNTLDRLVSRNDKTSWVDFPVDTLNNIFKYMSDNKLIEEYKMSKVYLYTGLRRDELVYLKVKDIDFEKSYLDLKTTGTKTENSQRIIVLHKDIVSLLEEQVKDKNPDDYIFYNEKNWKEERRGENTGSHLNKIILKIVGKDNKEGLNVHSFRKNFLQEIFLSGEFKGLDHETIAGHSTSGNVTDKHYLLGKRNYKMLKEQMDRVDFSHYFKYKQQKFKSMSAF
nr:site-specific integrase [Malaciobacter halophilus]